MNRVGIALFAAGILLLSGGAAMAHRLDEYLHAATLDLTRTHILLHLRLTPGMDVANDVIRQMDRNSDGRLSPVEQRAYVSQIMQGLSLSLNGRAARLRVEALTFPTIAEMRAGTGVIDLRFSVKTGLQTGSYRLTYRDRGAGTGTVWLVNCLLPQDPAIHVTRQKRSEDQSSYMLDFSISPP
ncbi:hypothetical protein [Novacetimonas pomaceti]|uniref:EF-hand domain-containing protein n=1 Tax=Novacetimonas pomaceti TaxID=2021998 RepID=A0A318QC97_9PROT|nr:hypothetical protein [Novacetimonas pomaceti]PYD75464.1 hypothetical protein CFR71_09500 [Novacetimonas pomaceti]